MKMTDIAGEVVEFVRKASAVSGTHYPERSAYIYIINIPTWFSYVWSGIKTVIDPVTREKIHMVPTQNVLKSLREHISEDQIPSDYGGSGVALGYSDEERRMAQHVAEHLETVDLRLIDAMHVPSATNLPIPTPETASREL